MDLLQAAAAWIAHEVLDFGFRWTVIGALAVLSILLFGRNYKKRIAALETKATGPAISQTFNYNANVQDPEKEIRNAAQAETAQNLEQTIRSLPQHPMGNGATYADLPEHTRIVSLPDGRYLLALPIRISLRAGSPRIEVSFGDAALESGKRAATFRDAEPAHLTRTEGES